MVFPRVRVAGDGEKLVVPILAGKMKGCTHVYALHPGRSRPIPKEAVVPTIVRITAAAGRALEAATVLADYRTSLSPRNSYEVHIDKVSAIVGGSESSPIAV